ncbi:uncharacterized protein LOC132736041 [Ruditapes philippinarum]|uniref:uncharacterized protein LOC132736041 n=1 Tax=Ruditapes philippinarum TaxID=129788 RepID=UPI00295ADDAB|nr:uncharacterized protein LOC132736041 [Ruditapes philippinarum]
MDRYKTLLTRVCLLIVVISVKRLSPAVTGLKIAKMNAKLVCLGLLLLGSCLVASMQIGRRGSRRVRLIHGDYDCSCSYYCPPYGIKAGLCYDNDYWGWGRQAPQYCCVPSYIDYDAPDFDNGFTSFGRRK